MNINIGNSEADGQLAMLILKGELNLYNKWQSDDMFHIVINENHPRGNRFRVILKILTFTF